MMPLTMRLMTGVCLRGFSSENHVGRLPSLEAENIKRELVKRPPLNVPAALMQSGHDFQLARFWAQIGPIFGPFLT